MICLTSSISLESFSNFSVGEKPQVQIAIQAEAQNAAEIGINFKYTSIFNGFVC